MHSPPSFLFNHYSERNIGRQASGLIDFSISNSLLSKRCYWRPIKTEIEATIRLHECISGRLTIVADFTAPCFPGKLRSVLSSCDL